jgi:hypothetical protein
VSANAGATKRIIDIRKSSNIFVTLRASSEETQPQRSTEQRSIEQASTENEKKEEKRKREGKWDKM